VAALSVLAGSRRGKGRLAAVLGTACLVGSLLQVVVLVAKAVPAFADTYSTAVMADSPMSYWRLDDGGSTAVDATGANDGSIVGGVTTGVSGAISGDTAMSFDGSTGYVNVPSTTGLNDLFTGSYTVEVWINTTSTAQQRIVGKWPTSGDGLVTMIVNAPSPGQLSAYEGNGADIDALESQSSSLDDGNWHQIDLVRDASVSPVYQRLYVDGNLDAERPESEAPTANSSAFQVGHDGSANADYFDGSIDEVALFSGALSPSRIQAHYEASGRSITPPVVTYASNVATYSPTWFWRLNEASGTTANDTQGNSDAAGTINSGVTLGEGGANPTDTAMSFDGSSEAYIDVPTSAELNGWMDGNYSVVMWYKSSSSASQRLFGKFDVYSGGVTIILNDPTPGHVRFYSWDGTGVNALESARSNLDDGNWHQLVAERNNGELSLYFDGQLDSMREETETPGTNSVDLQIGHDGNSANDFTDGSIGEVALFTYVLSTPQVQLLAGSGGPIGGIPAASER